MNRKLLFRTLAGAAVLVIAVLVVIVAFGVFLANSGAEGMLHMPTTFAVWYLVKEATLFFVAFAASGAILGAMYHYFLG